MEKIAIDKIKKEKNNSEASIIKFEVQSTLKRDSKRTIAAKVGNFFIELSQDGKKEIMLG